MADGGDWKMGPFGPYWDENEWPEFTPMYWMEEFMNRLDDDDDDIREWMLRNQAPGQYPQAGTMPGGNPYYGWGAPSPYPWQPYAWNPGWGNPYSPYSMPYAEAPPAVNPYPARPGATRGLYPDAGSRVPRMSPRSFGGAPERQYAPRRESIPRSPRETLPNLTPEEFARMPPELQRRYKRDFDREYTRYRAREAQRRDAWQREMMRRPPASSRNKRSAPVPFDPYSYDRYLPRY